MSNLDLLLQAWNKELKGRDPEAVQEFLIRMWLKLRGRV